MKTVVLFLVSCFLFACNSKPANTPVEQSPVTQTTSVTAIAKDFFETGKVIPSVALRNNAVETFALYLPKIFKDSFKLHCIIFFDPHGDGTVPLEKYKELAEKNDFILIGSNFSTNDNVFENNLQHAQHLATEVLSRFHPLYREVIFCGFSGGAKVALTQGPWIEEVGKIIYCGATIQTQKGNHEFQLLGIAGNRDMNYTDLVSFYRTNRKTYYSHELIQWDGKHEWPDEKTFAHAIEFSQIGLTSSHEVTISDADVQKEQALKQQLLQAFQSQDINWWKQEIVQLNLKKKTDPMYERLLGFISLACYSYSNQTLQQNNLPAAEKILTIYQLADPGNKDCEAFTAQLKALQSQH